MRSSTQDPHPGNFVVMPGGVIGAMDFGKVGYLSDRDRRDLIQLFILAMTQDTEGIVDQLIQMGASSDQVDSKGLAQDIGRVLIEYQNVPLKDLHVAEAVQQILPITDRMTCACRANLWGDGEYVGDGGGGGAQAGPRFGRIRFL